MIDVKMGIGDTEGESEIDECDTGYSNLDTLSTYYISPVGTQEQQTDPSASSRIYDALVIINNLVRGVLPSGFSDVVQTGSQLVT